MARENQTLHAQLEAKAKKKAVKDGDKWVKTDARILTGPERVAAILMEEELKVRNTVADAKVKWCTEIDKMANHRV
ncbi:uncharacterized protein STEHIDRAFT_157387 [Stereum hirsutum FP-91666 SS1]|uniref:uncharacterized protein n=1 Tax=Stereum hirsutum (strain FP-91666) TaxID=721885 RepID=UPI00044492CA|nr:uncharacterized protein STEHIDRAFT_157387 [Stereum hirsutum FP-91666 SS1]EIM85848.1 hypothetical protein STEHIDRAFT_157387 [Stereum hirsutum FP-91666 SS1]